MKSRRFFSSSWCTVSETLQSYTQLKNFPMPSDWCSFSSFVPECQNYGSLTSRTRRTWYNSYNYHCDNRLAPGWFRFQGSAGTRMATSCPSFRSCGTAYPGWLTGGHPSVADGQVTRTVYFRGYSNCYYYSTSIKVRNCGSYYVYYLNGTPNGCYLRYCGTS